MSRSSKRLVKIMRWTGRIIALPLASFYFIFTIGEFIDTVANQSWQQQWM